MKTVILNSTLVLLLISVACSHKAPQSTPAGPLPDAPSQQETDDDKFGLPKSTRRAIYEELSKAKLSASMIARQRFPGRGSYILVPESLLPML